MSPNHKEALLDVTELTVYFNTDRGEVKALDRVELSVAKGEIVGLIG
jgi:ABC-type dipeptide/oligopeptide/nickel transport system ATPase component